MLRSLLPGQCCYIDIKGVSELFFKNLRGEEKEKKKNNISIGT